MMGATRERVTSTTTATYCQTRFEGKRLTLSGAKVARNAALNLGGNVVPLMVGVIAIPIIVHRLGIERFGVLAFAWVLLGYAGLFDLGIGRASTKYLAEAIGMRDGARARSIVWTSLLLELALGAVGALIVAVLAPFIARALANSPPLASESADAFVMLALAVPVTIAMATLRGVHEAGQRFDFVNLVGVPSNALTYILPLVGAVVGMPLSGIVALLVLNRVAGATSYALLAPRVLPGVWAHSSFDATAARSLLGFGGWVTLTSIIGPVIVYADRILVGTLLGAAALGYYSAPFDVLTRLWLVPTALVTTLFPWLSAASRTDPASVVPLYERAIRFLTVMVAPPVLIVVVFAHDLLRIWLGDAFADQGALPMRILACGMLANAIAQLPFILIQALGRPDLTAKLHAAELVPFLLLALSLITRFGLAGAAVAWSFRATVDFVALLVLARKTANSVRASSPDGMAIPLLRAVALLGASAAVAFAIDGSFPGNGAWGLVPVIAFIPINMLVVLNSTDRANLRTLVTQLTAPAR